MSDYKPLKGLRGMQTEYDKFRFSWNLAGNDHQAHFLWIYRESEIQRPQMLNYARCIENHVQVVFPFRSDPLQEIRKERFLVFLSGSQNAPSSRDLYLMSQKPEFCCEVYCGVGRITWGWTKEKKGVKLAIKSDKKVPSGVLYYEYQYGGKNFRFEIPGEIQIGDNYYSNIYFPDLVGMPQLKSRSDNVKCTSGTGKSSKNEGNANGKSGIWDKLASLIRH